MTKAENFGERWIDIDLPFPCEIHACRPRAVPDRSRFSVLVHYTEPRQIKWPSEQVRQFHGAFDLILTNEDSLLDLPNAQFSLFGGTWLKAPPAGKQFGLSFLYSRGIGHETHFAGYQDRRKIWTRRHEIQMPKRFFTSVMRPPDGIEDFEPYPYPDKAGLFESMFSVVVENDYQEHFFTEKLIDSLHSYTVPIYLGAPNIERYFEPAGMLRPRSVDELVAMVNTLTPDDYWRRMGAMLENHERSKPHWDLLASMKSYIEAGHRRLTVVT